MAIVKLAKNPMRPKFETHTYNGDLMDFIMRFEWCRDGIIVSVNGVIVADSSEIAEDEMAKALSIDVGIDDAVEIYARPFGVELSWWVIALIAVGTAVLGYALMPIPNIPNDQGVNDSSQNNQLNAASNAFRPREAIPDIAGQIRAYPDFIQRSYYTYVNNKRKFTEVLCFGVGYHDVTDVRDGDTLFTDLTASTATIYQPNQTIPASVLLDVRPAEGSLDLPLPAADDDTRTATIINGRFLLNDTVNLGETGPDIVIDLDLQIGDTIDLDVDYASSGTPLSYAATHTITQVSPIVKVSPSTLPFTDPLSVQGSITKTFGSTIGQWFELQGDSIEEVRFQLKMPQGIRKGDGTTQSVGFQCEVELLDGTGTPTGTVTTQGGVFSGDTLEPQYQTRFITGLTAGRYRARVYRTSNSLGDNSADLLVCERIEAVTPYSGANFGDVTIGVFERASQATQGRGASSKLNGLATRRLELFDDVTGTFATGTYTGTRSAFQYVMYLLNKLGSVDLSLIQYDELFAIESSLTATPELGYFDFSNDSYNVSLRERVEATLNAARCYNFMQGAIWRFGRDEAKPVRTFMINRRSLIPDTYAMSERFSVTNDFDSVEIRYVDPDENIEAYERRRIGTGGVIESGEGVRVKKIDLAGCRSQAQAANRADLEIRKIKYIRRSVQCQTAPDIMAADIGERGGVISPVSTDFVSGEVLEINVNRVTISEPVAASGFVYFVESDGSVSNSVAFTRVDDYNIDIADASSLYIADGYAVQIGSKFLASTSDDFSYNDYILTRRGRPDENFRVPVELGQYDARIYELD